MKVFHRPNGSLQGDDKAMPNRGTNTGMGRADSMGKSTDANATNSMGRITGATKSDKWDDCSPGDEGAGGRS